MTTTKKEYEAIKDKTIREIKTLFEQEDIIINQ